MLTSSRAQTKAMDLGVGCRIVLRIVLIFVHVGCSR
jgi:predicted tellurium resistance membrane protein TerC